MAVGDADQADVSMPPVPVLGARRDGLTMRLARADGAGASPFVVLHAGRFARVLLAEVVADDGSQVARFAWKLRGDDERARAFAGGRAFGNAEIDAMWSRERSELARVQSANVAARFPAPAALCASPPVVHCQRADVYFHPPAPRTGALLATCRDDGALLAAGLPPYAGDDTRYLLDDDGSGAPVFYRAGEAPGDERPRAGVAVKSGAQLIRDWTSLVHTAGAKAALPCASCANRTECFPLDAAAGEPIPAERELHFVSFHDVDAIALELHDFDWHETIALLGGGDLLEVLGPRIAGGRATAVAPAAVAALTAGPQWLFAGDPARWPLEVLRQKVALFEDVVAGVTAVHAAGRPHLGIADTNVVASFRGGAGRGAPARWQLHAALLDLGSAQPVVLPGVAPGAADAASLLEPGPELREDARSRAFVAPALQANEPSTVTMQVACRKATGGGRAAQLVVEGTLPGSGSGAPRGFRGGDVVAVQPVASGPILVARVEEVRPRGVLATASLAADDPRLQWDGAAFDARLSFHRRLGPAADFHGLGVLLLQTLLANDRQGVDEIVPAATKVLRRFDDEPTGVRIDERAAAVRLLQLVAAKDVRICFDAANVLHRRADRDAHTNAVAAGAPPIDAAIWQRLLVIACKLLGSSPSLAYVATPADAAQAPLQQLRADLAAVQQRLHVELFGAAARDAALAAACAEFADEVRALTPAAARGGAARRAVRGFRVQVQREGSTTSEDMLFELDRVTIGRREGENVLRLNDPMVSSLHATIEWSPEGWVVQDRNSTNGTEVDGIRLPGEVPQPLQDGCTIQIRPFKLVFHEVAPATDRTLAAPPPLSADDLREQLTAAWAANAAAEPAVRDEALRFVLRSAHGALGAELLPLLAQVAGGAGPVASQPGDAQRAIDAMAARSLAQLSRSLLGPGEFSSPDAVRTFVAKLSRFAESTSQWIERLLELKKALGKQLAMGAESTAGGRPPVRSAAEVRELALGWGANALDIEPSAWFLTRFYEDLLGILEGLIDGNQQVRRAVRERLDPDRLVEAAGRDGKQRLLVQAAAASALWKAYVQAFQEVTGGRQHEAEVAQLLQKAMQERSERA